MQRAEASKEYVKPRNIIIQYEPVQVRVIRQFQRLGVTQENPQAYLQRYGAQLLDAQSLVQQARSAGVVEDIVSPLSFPSMVKGDRCSSDLVTTRWFSNSELQLRLIWTRIIVQR